MIVRCCHLDYAIEGAPIDAEEREDGDTMEVCKNVQHNAYRLKRLVSIIQVYCITETFRIALHAFWAAVTCTACSHYPVCGQCASEVK